MAPRIGEDFVGWTPPDGSDEAMKLVEANGLDQLHMAFFRDPGVGNDGVWNVWQIEGPSMLWYFRGDPHVHTWVHIRKDPTQV